MRLLPFPELMQRVFCCLRSFFSYLFFLTGFFQASAQKPPRGICSDVTLPYLNFLLERLDTHTIHIRFNCYWSREAFNCTFGGALASVSTSSRAMMHAGTLQRRLFLLHTWYCTALSCTGQVLEVENTKSIGLQNTVVPNSYKKYYVMSSFMNLLFRHSGCLHSLDTTEVKK